MNKTAKMVAVSSLAVTALYGGAALAQLQVNCPQRFYVGENHACSDGVLVINPDGSVGLGGCMIRPQDPIPAQCIVSNGGVPPTRNVVVQFTAPSFFITGGGGAMAKIDNLRMQPAAGVPTPAAQFTFTPTEVANTVTLNIGGRLNYANQQAAGAYTGMVSIRAFLQ